MFKRRQYVYYKSLDNEEQVFWLPGYLIEYLDSSSDTNDYKSYSTGSAGFKHFL